MAGAQESIAGTPDDTPGVWLYSAGLSAGTPAAPTGQPAGAPTDDIIREAISFDLLTYVGDQEEEVDSFSWGPFEGDPAYGGQVDTTLAEVVEGLTTVDDFGYIAEGGDDAANFDLGTRGSFAGGLRAHALQDDLVIVPDGVVATGTLGPTGATTPVEADAALDGCEILIFEDAELSGMEIVLSSPTYNIIITLEDRQVDPNTFAGADDTLICIDLDSLPGFDGTFIDTISISDDGVPMTSPPRIHGDTYVEIDAIATRSLGQGASTASLNGHKFVSCDPNGPFSGMAGVEIQLNDADGNPVASTYTNDEGFYEFLELDPGTYTVKEMGAPGTESLKAVPGSAGGTAVDADTISGIELGPGDSSLDNDFYNVFVAGCGTGTPGYWKNHPEAWPVDEITIGGVTYSKEDAIVLMDHPTKKDKTYTMFQALVAAKLNVLIGNDDSCIADTIAAADDWMAPPPIGYGPVGSGVSGNSAAWKEGEPLYLDLDDYNNGLLCAPHRD